MPKREPIVADPVEGEEVIEQAWSDAEAQEAESMGWIPPDRSKKLPEGKTFLDPVKYMERNPLYGRMKSLESSFGQLTEHYQKASERDRETAKKEYEAKIESLNAKKVEALDAGEHKTVVDIDEAIRTTEKPVEPVHDPVFDLWAKDNDWYIKDKFLAVQADNIAQKYLNEGVLGKAMLDETTKDIKKGYPDRFKTARSRPASVEGDTGKPAGKTKELSEKDLTAEERTIYRNFEKIGSFPKDEHKQQYFKDAVAART